jgi:CubicO group peptidase (beta-lactamase class C family)
MTGHVLRDGTAEEAGMDPVRIRRARDLAASWVARGDTPSLVVLVARRGRIVLHEAFGVRHHEDTTPTLQRDSIFPVMSVSKPVTAALVMCLVEDGLIGLNRPFVDYVPEWDVPAVQWLEEASVADLLRHTAGIDDLALGAWRVEREKQSPDLPGPGAGQHPALNRIIRLGAGAPLARRPGTAMIYSNIGYLLLSDIVRRVSGRPFWQFARDRLFEPLGMTDSHFVLPEGLRERRIFRQPGMPGAISPLGFPGIDSAELDARDTGYNGLASTARDLASFLQMLVNRGAYDGRRILSPASVVAMTRPQLGSGVSRLMPFMNPKTGKREDIEIPGGDYGYGLFVMGPGDRFARNGALATLSAVSHVGFVGTLVWADPERELVGVYLSVSPRLKRDWYVSNGDLFQNAVHAAIV